MFTFHYLRHIKHSIKLQQLLLESYNNTLLAQKELQQQQRRDLGHRNLVSSVSIKLTKALLLKAE